MVQAAAKLAGVALAGTLLAGCAQTAVGARTSAVAMPEGMVSFQNEAPMSGAMVVVRYPASLDPQAEDAYYTAFARTPIGGSASSGLVGSPEARQVADGMVVKSSYFALSLYKELAERLPEQTVLLSPHQLTLDASGKLTSEPMTDAESLPNVLTVDFSTYSFPDPEKMMSSEPLTFGDLITPLVVVHADHRSMAPTHGVLMASSPLMRHAGGEAREEAAGSIYDLQQGLFTTQRRPLDFVAFLNREGDVAPPTQGLTVNGDINAAQTYPLEKFVMNRAVLARMEQTGAVDIDPLETAFSAPLAQRIVDIANDIEPEKAAMVQRAAAVARFDPGIAALSLVGLADDDVRTRFRYAERLLSAERKFLAVQSEKIYEGIHEGEMGQQVRELIAAEYDVINQRREIARQQNAATAAAILGAVAAGAVAAGSDGDVGDYLAADLLADLAVVAAAQAFSLNSQSKQVGSVFLESVVPALEEQIEIQVNLIDSNETITAIRFEDFQEILQDRYASSHRAIDTVATRCAFTGAGSEPRGTWQGECDGGLANGAGVGVIQLESGTTMEYFGSALNGQPSGVGYAIYHTGGETWSAEGVFANGQPDGAVRVARGGRADEIREFDGGRDAGPAMPGARVPGLFDQDVYIAGFEPVS
ncbi:MAG: hypothetical protein AAF216_12280 [Pseudomonadota bacterium]